jgi:hypothetical protein
MEGRPCRLDSDSIKLWGIILPNTPVPRCGVGQPLELIPQSAEPAMRDKGNLWLPLPRRLSWWLDILDIKRRTNSADDQAPL